MIQSLEDELGVRLFQRTTRRLTLTEAGKRYLESIEPLTEGIEAARQVVLDDTHQARGLMRVTTSVSFGQQCLLPLLPILTARHPDLQLDLVLTDSLMDLVVDRVDLAIRIGPRSPPVVTPGLVASQLMPVRYRVCVSPAYLKHHLLRVPKDLAAVDCVLFPWPGFRTCWKFRERRGGITEVPVKGRVVISAAIGVRACALRGMGPALLPEWLVQADLKSGLLQDPFPRHVVTASDFNTAVWLLYPSRAYLPHKVRVLIDFLREHVPALTR